MAKCKNCGKEIAKGLDFCSKECMEAYKEKLMKTAFLTQFDKGSGSDRRSRNIDKIVDLLKQGVNEDYIKLRLRRYFKPSTVDDYIETAKALLKMESEVNQLES
ncbi:MAG: DUF2116 family Zn-ribbon domain-containing protein [Candidatus Bathyarchaeia archaeon]